MNWEIGKNLEDVRRRFKNCYQNHPCFILGNGPSLTFDLIDRIAQKGIFIFTVNGFALVLDKVRITVNAVCMSNEDAVNKYLNLYPDETLKFIRKSEGRARSRNSNVYELPFDCEHEKGIHKAKFLKDGYFSLDPFKENFCGDTVVLDFCFPLAFFMGFTMVYLGGVDCDYIKGYFVENYEKSSVPRLRGMLNNDFSIAIPSYRYMYDFLTERGVNITRFTESEKLSFIPFKSLEDI